jgi:hypothetical protein
MAAGSLATVKLLASLFADYSVVHTMPHLLAVLLMSGAAGGFITQMAVNRSPRRQRFDAAVAGGVGAWVGWWQGGSSLGLLCVGAVVAAATAVIMQQAQRVDGKPGCADIVTGGVFGATFGLTMPIWLGGFLGKHIGRRLDRANHQQ